MPTSPTIITCAELIDLVYESGFSYGPDAMSCLKASYAMPTLEWVSGPLLDIWWQGMRAMRIPEYSPGKWNCVNYAEMLWNYTQLLHARTPGAPDVGFAIGRALKRGTPAPHAFNVAAVQLEDASRRLFWIEPQNPPHLVDMTKQEVEELIYDIRF